ncbi:MAG: hypothetical protein IPO32_06420 [Crocinitomicaceae bacterium]|nr:hypothetical protein [Crocinitomicaceae bacterium]
MEILKFIFVLGINFSIFGFIWGLMMLVIRMFRAPGQPANQGLDYTLRIVKYFLLVSVTANYIAKFQGSDLDTNVGLTNLIVGTIVMTLYLLGKLQNRAVLSQLGQHPLFTRFANSVDPKVERFLLLGSIAYFVACLIYPQMVDNRLVNWFTDSIQNIYDTPIIGWIFSVIAFFFLISILLRAANVIGRLLNGQSITSPGVKTNFGNRQNRFDSTQSNNDTNGFADYEDVTDEEDKTKKS